VAAGACHLFAGLRRERTRSRSPSPPPLQPPPSPQKTQDRLPTPYGLARSGVAPDHQDVKNVTRQFEQDLADPRLGSYFGGVRARLDGEEGDNSTTTTTTSSAPAIPVAISELRELYDAVVLAHGAESDWPMRVPGEALRGVVSAREFVWWYNGHPDASLSPALRDLDPSRVRSVAVCGVGNVALDVARLLLRPPVALARTDVAAAALSALRRSAVKDVHLFARRGPVQAACTPMELKELLAAGSGGGGGGGGRKGAAAASAKAAANAAALGLPATAPPPPIVRAAPGALDVSDDDRAEMAAERPKRRLYEIMTKAAGEAEQRMRAAAEAEEALRASAASASDHAAASAAAETAAAVGRTLHLQFYRNPVELLPGSDGTSVAAVRVERTRLERSGGGGGAVAVGTGEFEEHEVQLVLKSIGYRTLPLMGVPYDARRAVVPNAAGRVLVEAAAAAGGGGSGGGGGPPATIPGLYVCGWAKRGPTGVIGTNLTDAEETVASLAADRDALLARRRQAGDGAPAGGAGLAALLQRRGDGSGQGGWVGRSGWARIDAAELAAGASAGKVREKMTDVAEMLRVAGGGG